MHFQQDNALCHVSKCTKKWFNDHSIPLLFHPPNSPDLSSIEPVWHELKKVIRSLTSQPNTINELKAAVHTTWDQLDINDVDKHISNMPNCVTAIIKARGGHTQF